MIRYYLRNPEWSLERKTDGASGYDLRADLHVDGDKAIVTDGVDIGLVARLNSIIIPPGGRVTIKTGLHLEMPIGVEAQVRSRSGLASKHGIVVVMGVGTVDSDYRGDVSVSLVNLDWQNGYEIKHGDRREDLREGPRDLSPDDSTKTRWGSAHRRTSQETRQGVTNDDEIRE